MDAVQFLQKSIQINSCNPPGNEHEVAKLFAERCKKNGIPYQITEVDTNRSNFTIQLKGKGAGKIIFCGHMDTVLPGEQPWEYDPFSGVVVGDKLYGRGASDMKSGLCAMFLAIESLIQEKQQLDKDIIFLATAGEEVDSCGARLYLQTESMVDVDALIIGEPTNEKVVIGHKGALWVEIVTYGKTAHGSMPNAGINAVEWMQNVMLVIESLKSKWKLTAEPLGESTAAMTKISGGVQANVIPDKCSLYVDIRSVPPQSHEQLLSDLRQSLHEKLSGKNGVDFSVNMLLDRPPILTDSSSDIIKTALEIKGADTVHGASYYTDAAVLNPKSSVPTLIYGPGNEKIAHQPNEYVDVNAYLRSIDFYKELALRSALS